ncbi:hypothetical protein CVT24_012077 [Panaeolus cyanescens]|uniref:Peroxisomal membrane protein PEX14 n=1 Tax=Panaeolus cyanescens TaxID=181874 RepID=A0A409VYK0_9AGAR|nr:hypothetical protein CVT24_012077 [Panaeolus cyanescens]
MATPDRQELVRNAVAFLSDPKTQASPVTQRIQFLEAKGLTPAEIDIALKQASAGQVAIPQPQYGSPYAMNQYAMPPPPQRWDWRDYFITAVVSGAVTYGAVSLFKKFLYPHLQPPTSTAYEEDRDALNAQFDAAEALLKEIQAETASVRAAVEEQKDKIDKTTEDVKNVVADLRQGEVRTRDEMREVRDEVNNIREMLPKMIEKNKESQNQSLAELQQELKSLKALLLSRPAASTPTTSFPLAGRPTIPSWQLASTPQTTDSSSSSPAPPIPTSTISTGKGKEPELAQQPARILDASSSSSDGPTEAPSRSQSLDIRTGSSQLAETAISSLRKSFVSQRANSSSPSNSANSTPASSSATGTAPAPRPKSNLEERLRRATYAIGDANKGNTSSPSPAVKTPRTSDRTSASPSPMARVPIKSSHKPSPASTPLPGSPVITPAKEPKTTVPTDLQLNQRPDSPALNNHVAVPNEPKPSAPVTDVDAPTPPNIATTTAPPQTDTVDDSHSNEQAGLQSEPDVQHPDSDKVITIPETASDSKRTEQGGLSTIDPTTVTATIELPSETIKGGESVQSGDHVENPLDINLESTPSASVQASTPEVPAAIVSEEDLEGSAAIDATGNEESGGETLLNLRDNNTVTLPHIDVSQSLAHEIDSTTSLNPSPVPKSPNLIGVDPEEPVSPRSDLPPTEFEPEIVNEVMQRVLLEKEVLTEPLPLIASKELSSEVEALQARLKQVEQRFSDVSTSFKRLQAEKQAADAVLREVSPLESIKDADALRDFFADLKVKDQVFQDEIKRLNQKLEAQEDRMENVQATHRQELRTLNEEKHKIKTQLDETEKLFEATQASSSQAEDAANAQKEEISRLERELEVQKALAKEEEEKRVKAISLLKTVRQKLVKAEKDREDAVKELASAKEREKSDRSKEDALKHSLQQEMEKANVNHERAIATLRSQFDKDNSSLRERYEQEIAALRGQAELEVASLKTTHLKDINAKTALIASLESTVNKLTRDKNEFFDSLQLRQAELESAQSHLESLQHQNTELQFQLRESNERLALLKEEAAELMREQESRIRDPVVSADEIGRMVSATEAKYEARLAEAQRRLATMEKERYESEADWSRKLKEKVKDLEELRRILGTANKSRENDESIVAALKEQLTQEKNLVKTLQNQITQLPLLKEHIIELEKTTQEQEKEISVKNQILEKQAEESKAREAQQKQINKSLRDELRKVQSSAALLERQRNPGVGGYWGSRAESSANNGSAASLPSAVGETPSRVSSPAPTTSSGKQEEEVNLEYLRNVILQFLEHKEMRPNLVKVLSIILHFTPQETRRLIAKV